jgi:hypothetical protein
MVECLTHFLVTLKKQTLFKDVMCALPNSRFYNNSLSWIYVKIILKNMFLCGLHLHFRQPVYAVGSEKSRGI